MSHSFSLYSEISARSLEFNPKMSDVVAKKAEILTSIQDHHHSQPNSVLFVGFSPLMLAASYKEIYAVGLTNDTKKWLDGLSIKYISIDDDQLNGRKFDWVVACDEYFTFAASEDEQRLLVEKLVKLTNTALITTLRDYKNFDYKDREFSYPLAVHKGKESMVFLEYHDCLERNSWQTTVYEIQGDSVEVSGPFARSSMFFKQLAKFSIDAGAKNFYVHKNLMYKSVIKKNYEHVISISV